MKNVFSAVRIIAAMVVAAHYVFLLGFCVCVGVADDCACYSCSDFVVLLVPIGVVTLADRFLCYHRF